MVTVATTEARAGAQSVVTVHISGLDVPDVERTGLLSLLSADELARAERLRFRRDRDRFIVARARLRAILGAELSLPPESIRFRYEADGKPALDATSAAEGGACDLAFNLSHTADVVMVAVGRGCRIGADIEQVLDDFDIRSLAPYCLAASEIAALEALPAHERRRAFFQCWVRKEAYLKGCGTGVAGSLDDIAIEPRAGTDGLSRVRDPGRGATWQVHDLPAPLGFTAALALDAPRSVVVRAWITDIELEGFLMRTSEGSQQRPSPAVHQEGADGAVYNERGVIAERYSELQGLPVLDAARAQYPLPPASPASTIRAVFQSCEIALLNLADLMRRAATDVEAGETNLAMVKLSWARGFHRLLVRLSLMPQQLASAAAATTTGRLRIDDSPGFAEYVDALSAFDRAMLCEIDAGRLPVDETLSAASLDRPLFALIHATRVANHESTIWEDNLADVPMGCDEPSYARFVSAAGMRDAVYDRILSGDTYFTQFRGLHQIPETLGEEANDHLEQTVRDIRAGRLGEASMHLRAVTVLTEGMLASLPPMADNLATADYHEIRENLGLTSGSHSVCLRFHMFSDLYEQLSAALTAPIDASESEPTAWLLDRLQADALTFRSLIFQWRDAHLHMPRNNLGGGATKSLTGSPDAVSAVKRMRQAARTRDPMMPLALSRGLRGPASANPPPRLRAYLDSAESLDTHLLVATGRVTQERFVAVQQRLGFFAGRCPFSAPPPRRA
jgi:phosphopantetheinyl transferase